MRGARSIPPQLKKLTKKERVRLRKVRPFKWLPGSLEAPKDVQGLALAEWKRVAPLLLEMGLFAACDSRMLAMYCHWYARFEEARQMVEKEGRVIRSVKGSRIRNPWVSIMVQAAQHMRVTATDLGLTAASRAMIAKFPDCAMAPQTQNTTLGKLDAEEDDDYSAAAS